MYMGNEGSLAQLNEKKYKFPSSKVKKQRITKFDIDKKKVKNADNKKSRHMTNKCQ